MEHQLLVFKEVAETKNITLSAKNLQISQPSVSLQIQNLENEYGIRFFDRTNKGVTLTKEGEIFYASIRGILGILASLKEEMSAIAKNQKRLIRLGVTLTIGEYVLPNIMADLYKTHPDVEFRVKSANSESIAHDVSDKIMHIGLIEGAVPPYENLKIESFWDDELVVVIPNFHPWASRNSISLSEISNEPLVTREEGSETRKAIQMALKERGFALNKLNVTMELGSNQAIKKVVSAGLGITIMSSLTVSCEWDRKIFRTLRIQDKLVHCPFSIITNEHSTQTEYEHVLINLLHDHKVLSDILSTDYYSLQKQRKKA